ncbi:hypothetical protein AVEN_135042-1 [Araneus ventricosus]|uniref:Uncharacterized protein n=1 Tax=Araneus ventricosus TaxID=182803 RepID=A0A4Y2CXZ0_ARAVE|nr:hypothetical protein AVEN_135042-1 [Araneus ventricosus]
MKSGFRSEFNKQTVGGVTGFNIVYPGTETCRHLMKKRLAEGWCYGVLGQMRKTDYQTEGAYSQPFKRSICKQRFGGRQVDTGGAETMAASVTKCARII